MKILLTLFTFCCVFNAYVATAETVLKISNSTKKNVSIIYEHMEVPFESKLTGVTYPVHIFVPDDYDKTTKSYPVIYATDGQWHGKYLVDMLAAQQKEVIYIAIEQGPDKRRNIDYVVPGLQKYFQFLTTELVPTLEKSLRVNSSKRTLMGTSLGGLFVNAAVLLEDPHSRLFSTYLSFDASMSRSKAAFDFLLKERFKKSPSLPIKLILTTATRQGNSKAVKSYQKKLEKVGFEGLSVSRIDIPVTHQQVATPSFKKAIPLFLQSEYR